MASHIFTHNSTHAKPCHLSSAVIMAEFRTVEQDTTYHSQKAFNDNANMPHHNIIYHHNIKYHNINYHQY